MRKKVWILIIIFICAWQTFCQVNKYGIPFIRNYTPIEYEAAEQNWCIVQDKRGVMYFGNNDKGVLEYDGVKWRKILVPNNTIVRSLAIDSSGTIYVGVVDDFGMLKPDKTGRLQYISLASDIDSADRKLGEVWKIWTTKESVYFCSVKRIFCYNIKNKKLSKFKELEKYSFFSFYCNDRFYIGNYVLGLMELKDTSLRQVRDGTFFSYKNIFVSLPYGKDSLLIGTSDNGLYLYSITTEKKNNQFFSTSLNNLLNKSTLYYGINLPDRKYALGTLFEGSGALTIDHRGNIIEQFNKTNGLKDDQVTSLFYSNSKSIESSLWITANNSLSNVLINNPIRYFGEESGLKGIINDIYRYKDVLYVATSIGLFYLSYNTNGLPVFNQIDGIGQAWSLTEFNKGNKSGNILLIGTYDGIFEFDGGKIISVDEHIENSSESRKIYSTYFLYTSRKDSSLIYIGTNTSFVILQCKNGKWRVNFEKDIKNDIRSIAEDAEGNIWFSTSFNGVYLIDRRNGNDTTLQHYDTSRGLPTMNSVFIYHYNFGLIFATERGLYKLNTKKDRLMPDYSFGLHYADGSKSIHRFVEEYPGKYWLSMVLPPDRTEQLNWVETITINKESKPVSDSISYCLLPNFVVDIIYHDKNNITWFGNSKGLYSYNKSYKKKHDKYYALIRKVELIGQDSVLFFGTYYKKNENNDLIPDLKQPAELEYEIDYKYRNITFHFASPYFEMEEKTEFSYYLEGYDNTWSKWERKSYQDYTNLSEGDYIFMVKAKNVYGLESEQAAFSFTISPPWYRTIWAYIIYGICSIALIITIVKVYTRRLELEKIRLEGIVKDRTAEVVKQKDEITDQRDQIAHINKELTDSIHYAERIQKAILPNIDYTNQFLDNHFILFKPKDIVSGDFFWATNSYGKIIVTAADCTGHGVPGAFMSMLGIAYLNEIVTRTRGDIQTNQIVDELRSYVIKALQQKGVAGEQKDGMDISICMFDNKKDVLQWTGANNPLYFVRKKDEINRLELFVDEEKIILEPNLSSDTHNLYEIKADSMPVAIYVVMNPFTLNRIPLQKNDAFYMFSDGYADQFGGPKGKKYMYKQFKKLILSLQDKHMTEQKTVFDQSIEDWKAHINPDTNSPYPQIDDIVVIGIIV